MFGEPLGLDNPEFFMVKHNGFITYLCLIFTNLNEAQSYEIPYRDSPQHEIEKIMSLKFLETFKPNENSEENYNRVPKIETSYLQLKIENMFM